MLPGPYGAKYIENKGETTVNGSCNIAQLRLSAQFPVAEILFNSDDLVIRQERGRLPRPRRRSGNSNGGRKAPEKRGGRYPVLRRSTL